MARRRARQDPPRAADRRDGTSGELPHTPYYGSVDSTRCGSSCWARPSIGPATASCRPVCRTRSPRWAGPTAGIATATGSSSTNGGPTAARNQGWKDSSDAIRDRTGREAVTLIALAEVQGYAYDARRRMAGLARVRGDEALASGSRPTPCSCRLASRRRSGWRTCATTRWRSMATSGRPTPSARTPGSACGADRRPRARSRRRRAPVPSRAVLRLGIPHAAGQPGYNPIGYHTGTVWPHDTSLVAAGLKRYGFDDASNQLVGRVFEAAQQFPDFRLPELFCGFDRDHAHAPVPGRLLAAGLGGRGAVPPSSCRPCSGCARMPNGESWSCRIPHRPSGSAG